MRSNAKIILKTHGAYALAISMSVLAPGAMACGDMDFRGEAVTIERKMESTANGAHGSIQVIGGGWFHAAEVVKLGGSSDNTTVVIELDGREMMSTTFADLKNPWRQVDTGYILANVRTEGATSRMTIWYSPELKFRGIMAVRVFVEEESVNSVLIHAVLNKPAPHEYLADHVNAPNLPIFK